MKPNGHEASHLTVLIVDNDPTIVDVVSKLLKESDYNVLSAKTGDEGLQLSRKFKGEIQVLVSDFQMSGISGIDLASTMTRDRPKLKVLLMSTFPKGLLVLNEGWHFLTKPFMASQLRALIETLANPDKASRYAGDLENAEMGEVRPPRLSPEVSRFKAAQENKP